MTMIDFVLAVLILASVITVVAIVCDTIRAIKITEYEYMKDVYGKEQNVNEKI